MNGNPFALAVGQTISYREPDHSYSSAKRNYTNLAFMQTHQKIYAEQRNIIEVLISLAKSWYNSQETEQISLPAGLIFLRSPRQGRGRFWLSLAVPWPRPKSKIPWEAWPCWAVPAPGAPSEALPVAWLRGTSV